MPGSVEFAYPSDRLFESCLKCVTSPFNLDRQIRRLSFRLVALPTAVLYVVFLLYRYAMAYIYDNLVNADNVFPRCGIFLK
jgi:hypothetical protein